MKYLKIIGLGIGILVILIAMWKFTPWLLLTLFAAYAALSLIFGVTDYSWRNYMRRNPEAHTQMTYAPTKKSVEHPKSFAFILSAAAKREVQVIEHTLENAAQIDWPAHLSELHVSLREGDTETIAIARRVEARYPDLITVHVNPFNDGDENTPGQKKAAQLNAVLPFVRAQYVSPLDAESIASHKIFEGVNSAIHATDADVVIAPVQLTNLDITGGSLWRYITREWFAVHLVMEYRSWFSQKMFRQQDTGFVPLSGNSVLIKTDIVRPSGWDDAKLTEDADLGVRLCAERGAKIVTIYSPELATREHTPPRIFGKGGMVRQRVRWDQGFIQVLLDGKWLKMPTLRQRIAGLYILTTPLFQALNGIMLPLAIVSAFLLKAPLVLTMPLFIPLVALGLTMITQMLDLREFCRDFGLKAKLRHYLSLVIGFYPFQLLLGIAALIAIRREYRGDHDWGLTDRITSAHAVNASVLTSLYE